ncbi:MAG TPA: penicillin-binding protein 2 [Solirubrobacteraceae bacterium]|nr:penicillin-binding protein 2 [Solirubrobacteraceae bacterium]
MPAARRPRHDRAGASMNRSIIRLFAVVILLFTVLVVWTSRWTVFSATALDNNHLNRLSFFASLKVKRGSILADNGLVLAKSVKDGAGLWKRVYPRGSLFSQVIGYALPEEDRYAGLELARNPDLKGLQSALTSVFGSFNGTPTVGDDVHTTIDPKAQELARQQIQHVMAAYGATSGSVVAIVPQTGAVRVMYSSPSYNDNNPTGKCTLPGCSQFFNAVQGGDPPGSTFKLITTTAALDAGRYTPDSTFNGDSPVTISGHSLENDGNASYGQVTLTYALTNSINTVFGPLGLKLGADVMQQYMQRYGFYSVPPLDYPANEMAASGELFYKPYCGNRSNTPKLVRVTSDCVDLGRTAIGQANLAVTPLQMAMVVSAIANNGKLMQPRLTSKVVNSAGQTVQAISPQVDDQVMKPKVASELQAMMRKVVEEGTGTAANLGGLNIGGKTGTASTGGTRNGQPLDDAWFVGFPESNPRIAVAVELSDIENGFGGTYAAPIAAKVIQTLLAEHP